MRHYLTGLLTAALLAIATPTLAAETGLSSYLKGSAGFMSGILPPTPGFYFTNTYYYFSGSSDAVVRGGVAELGVGMTMNADLLQGVEVTKASFLGGTYAFGGVLAVASAALSATVAAPAGNAFLHQGTSDLADSVLMPVILGWHDGNLHWSVALNVYVPTGAYDKNQLSVGKNVWGFMPQFALTWFDPASGWDVSGTFVYVTTSNNGATNYQSGDLFHLDWAIGKHFGEGGAWELGIAGNVVQQIGSDSGTGAVLGPFKTQSLGIGPALAYSTAIGKTPLILNAKWESDFDSHKTMGGDLVTVSATIVF